MSVLNCAARKSCTKPRIYDVYDVSEVDIENVLETNFIKNLVNKNF